MPYSNIKGAFGFGEESTWGTAVAAARWSPLAPGGGGLRRKREVVPVELLYGGGNVGPVLIDQVTLSDRASGSMSGPLAINEYWLTAALKNIYGGVTTAGSGPYTHTYAFSTTNQAVGLTIRHQNADYQEIYSGCRIGKLVHTFEARKTSTWSADIIAKTTTGAQSVGSPTFTTGRLYLTGDQVGQVTFNSVAYTCRRAVVTIDAKLAERDELGSLNTAEPTRTGMTEVMIELELYRVSNALMAAHYAGTQANASFTVTNGAASVAYTLHNGIITDYDPGFAVDAGAQVERVTIRGMADATNGGLGIVVTNANSAAI